MLNPSHSRRRPLVRAAQFALLLIASASLHAEPSIAIPLNGSAEVPPVSTTATGSSQITVLPDRSVNGSVKISGMVPTMAHIHEAAVGKNGPPIITLLPAPNDSYAVPAGAKLTEAQYASYTAGKLYVNVHSAKYPDGEIRAQLLGKPMRLAN
ncbi:CHRD domain-containing protein [Azonexus sp. IMCC34842]|uniref:CHRD domain-containing protein n=1 Tax=Azonexus sp. IMCC34842 TaxID=3420950 RepID=UPI003D139283